MSWKRIYPFNAEQTVNIASEFGPLATMFIVNAIAGINAGTWALLISTVVAMVVMRMVLGRFPVFPLIASTVTIVFGILTLLTGNPMWVQIKVTIFNAMFAVFLFASLWMGKNFFQHIFERTFHYTKEGWDRFTWSFAWFFVLTALANEFVRQSFPPEQYFSLMGYAVDGVNIWILFKIGLIMPLSGLYAWYLTRIMQKHRLPYRTETLEVTSPPPSPLDSRRKDAAEFASIAGGRVAPAMVRSAVGDRR